MSTTTDAQVPQEQEEQQQLSIGYEFGGLSAEEDLSVTYAPLMKLREKQMEIMREGEPLMRDLVERYAPDLAADLARREAAGHKVRFEFHCGYGHPIWAQLFIKDVEVVAVNLLDQHGAIAVWEMDEQDAWDAMVEVPDADRDNRAKATGFWKGLTY